MPNKNDYSTYCGIFGLGILILGTIISISNSDFIILGMAGFIIGIILIIIAWGLDKSEKEDDNRKMETNIREMSEWFDSKIKEYGINTDAITSIRRKEYSMCISLKYYYWIKNQKIYFFPQKESFINLYVSSENSIQYCEENARLISINISDIVYFKIIGGISYATNITSNGVNVKGAVIGSVIAGETGAIIGSRPQIKSQVEKKDDRRIELKYKDSEKVKTLDFDYIALDIFRDLFPEKEYEYMKSMPENCIEKGNEINSVPSSLEDRFKKLNKLKDAGLITEEEFSRKKEELLKEI